MLKSLVKALRYSPRGPDSPRGPGLAVRFLAAGRGRGGFRQGLGDRALRQSLRGAAQVLALLGLGFGLSLTAPGPVAAESSEIKLLYTEPLPGRVAFTYSVDDTTNIYVLDFASLSVRPMLDEQSDVDEYPVWSPDGRKIAFHSDRTGDREIFSATEDGSVVTQLTKSAGTDEDPDWSPDGAYLVFRTQRESGYHSIYVINQDGTNPRLVQRSRQTLSLPKWSPRGTEILFASAAYWPGWDIVLWELNTKSTTLLTNSVKSFLRPSWHPSGGEFLVSYGSGSEVGIWVFEKGAAAIKPLFDHPGKNYDAIWFDQAQKVLFAAEVTPGTSKYELFMWDKQSKKIHQITSSRGSIRHPSWTPFPSLRSIAEKILLKSGASN